MIQVIPRFMLGYVHVNKSCLVGEEPSLKEQKIVHFKNDFYNILTNS